jgi:hypothetical protein
MPARVVTSRFVNQIFEIFGRGFIREPILDSVVEAKVESVFETCIVPFDILGELLKLCIITRDGGGLGKDVEAAFRGSFEVWVSVDCRNGFGECFERLKFGDDLGWFFVCCEEERLKPCKCGTPEIGASVKDFAGLVGEFRWLAVEFELALGEERNEERTTAREVFRVCNLRFWRGSGASSLDGNLLKCQSADLAFQFGDAFLLGFIPIEEFQNLAFLQVTAVCHFFERVCDAFFECTGFGMHFVAHDENFSSD